MVRLYSGLTGQVVADRPSRTFDILRGTRQGDPMSSALFNAVLELVMRPLLVEWRRQRRGIKIGEAYLHNLRFADDVLIIGKSRADVRHMLLDLSKAAAKVGLKLHMGKTNILSNVELRKGVLAQPRVQIGAESVEVLPYNSSVTYLGRLVSFCEFQDTEIKHRINRGWAAFATFRSVLCCRHYALRSRLRLFESVVTPVVLYGSGCWTMTVFRENYISTARRTMLRKIVGTSRLTDADGQKEPWHCWIIRATDKAEKHAADVGLTSWIEQQKTRRRNLAERISKGPGYRWSLQVLHWQPVGFRRVGRPCKRWEDDAQ